MNQPVTGTLHHVEVWVPDLGRAIASWGWLLEALGYTMFQDWVDALVTQAPHHGWTLLFPERHPFAGGPDQYAAYLENIDGFEIELVAKRSC